MPYNIARQLAEEQLSTVAKEFHRLLELNEHRTPEMKIACSTYLCEEGGRFIAVNGSAHEMEALLKEFFTKRPEFRMTVQSVLNEMYQIADQ